MSRISEMEFYNDKDVITQIEWLKDHIGADHIKNITIEENTDPASPDFGKTKITMFMENGEYYEGSFTSALIKSVDSHQEGDEVVLEFHLATGETITARCKVIVHATASWDSLEGDPKSSVSLTEWMNTKTETTDFTNEVTARVQGDEKNASAITALDKTLSGEIQALDRNLSDKIAEIGTEVAKKESLTNKVTQWSETPGDTKYPSEKLVFDSFFKQHSDEITPTQPPELIISSIKQYGNPTVNTVDISFEKVAALSNTYVGHTDFKPIVQVNTAVISVLGGQMGGYITTNGDIYIWSTVPNPAEGSFSGVVVTYTVRRD